MDYKEPVSPLFKEYVIPSLFMCTFGCFSQVSTAVLAVVRMIYIYKPFVTYSAWVPLTYIAVFGTLMALNEIAYASLHFVEIDAALADAISRTVDFCLSLNISHCIIGIIASLLTVLKIVLIKKDGHREGKVLKVRSSCIICLMNVPYLFSVVNYTLSKTIFEKYGYFFLAFVAVSCFTSMFNPVLIVLLNRELRKFIKSAVNCNKDNPTKYVRNRKLRRKRQPSCDNILDQLQPCCDILDQSTPCCDKLNQSQPSSDILDQSQSKVKNEDNEYDANSGGGIHTPAHSMTSCEL